MEVPIFLKLRMLWNGRLRNLATQPVFWPVKIETALLICTMSSRFEGRLGRLGNGAVANLPEIIGAHRAF
jgi:hypothetical protein